MKNVYGLTLKHIVDERGALVIAEMGSGMPFEMRRVYYISQVPGDVRRGFHAHRQLQQVLVCVSGSCKIDVDDGSVRETISVSGVGQAMYIGPYVWHEMFSFSEDCVLLVLADDVYNEEDYIRDYSAFVNEVALR